LILGKGVTEVAASLSLPEAILIVQQDQTRRFEELRWQTQSRALAASAVWSKSAAQALGRFEESLRVDRQMKSKGKPANLKQLYQSAGLPVQTLK